MDDDLDQHHGKEEDDAPAALRVVVLEDARYPPLPVHRTAGHHTVLSVLHRSHGDSLFKTAMISNCKVSGVGKGGRCIILRKM